MILDRKLKQVALLAAADICLRKMNQSPKRCARNLVELGTTAYPDKLSSLEKSVLYHHLLSSFEMGDISAAKEYFTSAFL